MAGMRAVQSRLCGQKKGLHSKRVEPNDSEVTDLENQKWWQTTREEETPSANGLKSREEEKTFTHVPLWIDLGRRKDHLRCDNRNMLLFALFSNHLLGMAAMHWVQGGRMALPKKRLRSEERSQGGAKNQVPCKEEQRQAQGGEECLPRHEV